MTKHTPGPWSVYDKRVGGETYGIDGPHGEAVVWFGADSYNGIEKLADARLIAAAPELYELVKFHRFCTEIDLNEAKGADDECGVKGFTQKLAEIDAVLAKVEGDDA